MFVAMEPICISTARTQRQTDSTQSVSLLLLLIVLCFNVPVNIYGHVETVSLHNDA